MLIIYFKYILELSQTLGTNHKEFLFQMQSWFNKHWVDIFSSENYFAWVDANNLENYAKEV